MAPPVQYTVATPEPTPSGTTNGALALFTQQYKKALAACNADKAALADWASSITTP